MDPTELAKAVKIDLARGGLRVYAPGWVLVGLVAYGLYMVNGFVVSNERRIERLERSVKKTELVLKKKFPVETEEAEALMRRIFDREEQER